MREPCEEEGAGGELDEEGGIWLGDGAAEVGGEAFCEG
jgi:hypothetical protein